MVSTYTEYPRHHLQQELPFGAPSMVGSEIKSAVWTGRRGEVEAATTSVTAEEELVDCLCHHAHSVTDVGRLVLAVD